VLFLPEGTSVSAAQAAGYRVVSTRANAALGGTVYRLGLPAGRSVAQGTAELAQLVSAAIADENHLYTPDDFLCTDEGCAAQDMIGWSGWPSAFTPRVGMIDTGINPGHPALEGQKLTVHQAELDGRAGAGRRHGTAIATMLVGRMDYRVPGLLPNAELVAVEAFHRGYRGEQADAFSLAEAIDILLREQVSVINMSFSGPRNALLERLVTRAAELEVGMVAAAGNGGPGAEPAFPAAFPQVVAVTAVDIRGTVYRQANQGPYINLAAPGVRVWAAASISGGRLFSGTSYAAPFVTATLAVQRMRAPSLPLSETVTTMLNCAQDLGEAGVDPIYGHGLVAAPGQCFGEGVDLFSVSGE
jgi:subtilisin family serine protease